MQTSIFDYHLPNESIAQEPLAERDAARLLVIHRWPKGWTDAKVKDLAGFLQDGDLLILNNTRVIPARLRATRDSSGGKVEFLLVPMQSQEASPSEKSIVRRVLVKAGGKLKLGEIFTLPGGMKATLLERSGEAGDRVEFHATAAEFESHMMAHGEVPLPPYIRRPAGPSSDFDKQRYQTVFAQAPGAVAAPTAGLHLTERVFESLKAKNIEARYLTLHVGPGTFRPVKADEVENHFVDPEPYIIPKETAQAVAKAKSEKRRVIAVGTTSLRALEGAADDLLKGAQSADLRGQTNLFIYPPYNFRIVDGLVTNFHVPKSSLLMLVCAFAAPRQTMGIPVIKDAYAHALEKGYRFYSYGDACLII
jgi:S-adenosylmethionine:tRNA ribosyltransferase-isomerase